MPAAKSLAFADLGAFWGVGVLRLTLRERRAGVAVLGGALPADFLELRGGVLLGAFLALLAADFDAALGVLARLGEADRFEGDRAFFTELPPAATARLVGVLLRPRLGEGLAPRAFFVDALRLFERLREADRPRLADFLREDDADEPAKEKPVVKLSFLCTVGFFSA